MVDSVHIMVNGSFFEVEFTLDIPTNQTINDMRPVIRYTIQYSYNIPADVFDLTDDEFNTLKQNDNDVVRYLLPEYFINDEYVRSIEYDVENSFQNNDIIQPIDSTYILNDMLFDTIEIMNDTGSEVDSPRTLPYYTASTTCSGTGYATAPVSYTYYYYAGVNYYYYYCCPSGGSVSGSSCYYYYGATPVTYGQYECRAGGTLQTDGVTCLRNNC